MARRRSYEDRTRSNTAAAKILAEAVSRKVVFVETKQGDRIRQWRADEMQTFKHDDIARAISRKRALEEIELLEDVPPTAIKYAVTKRWLVPMVGLYFVTDQAAAELGLPKKTADGMTIKFAKAA